MIWITTAGGSDTEHLNTGFTNKLLRFISAV